MSNPTRARVGTRAIQLAAALAAALFAAGAATAAAEELWSDLGFFVEMPAGFENRGGDGVSNFAYTDPSGGMDFLIFSYAPGRFADVETLAAERMSKLGSAGETSAYTYEGRNAVFATLSFKLGSETREGLAVFIEGRDPPAAGVAKGPSGAAAQAPAAIAEPDYALIAHASSADFQAYAPFILSCLDAFSIDRAARRSPGPVSQYILPYPPERIDTRRVKLPGGASVDLPWSASEAEQEAETAGREYAVLVAYADEPELWIEAWGRFYRMAYRESAVRLDHLALEMSRTLPRGDPTEVARRILAWVQGFSYERDPEGTDYVPPLAAAYEGRGDCDARAVAAAILLERLGIDAIVMLSRDYSHAMFAVDVPGGGQRFAFEGKDYLVAETTAKVGIGMIAQDQANWSKWIGVQVGK